MVIGLGEGEKTEGHSTAGFAGTPSKFNYDKCMKCVYVRTDLYMKLHTELGRL